MFFFLKPSFLVCAIAISAGSSTFSGTAPVDRTGKASVASATATAIPVVKDDHPMFFAAKGADGVTFFVRENELDRPALIAISGGAKSVTVNGKTYEVDSTIVSRYGKTSIVDRSMVLMLDDER